MRAVQEGQLHSLTQPLQLEGYLEGDAGTERVADEGIGTLGLLALEVLDVERRQVGDGGERGLLGALQAEHRPPEQLGQRQQGGHVALDGVHHEDGRQGAVGGGHGRHLDDHLGRDEGGGAVLELKQDTRRG